MYIQFVGEDINFVAAFNQAREQANAWLASAVHGEILDEQVITTVTVAQKNIVIFLLRVAN